MHTKLRKLTALFAVMAFPALAAQGYEDQAQPPHEPPERAQPERPAPPAPPRADEAPTPPPPVAPQAEGPNIIEATREEGDFETLHTALETAGLINVLQGEGPFTLFAPTDEAFDALPEGTLDQLMQPENRQQLLQILAYHVVPGTVRSEDVEGGEVPTGLGLPAEMTVDGDEVRFEGARVVQTDISASNGVVHVLDRVVIPEN